jgi:hypothetical protein
LGPNAVAERVKEQLVKLYAARPGIAIVAQWQTHE